MLEKDIGLLLSCPNPYGSIFSEYIIRNSLRIIYSEDTYI